MKVRFCSACGRLILADFLFCPYCGSQSAPAPELEELLEEPFSRLEALGPASVEGRLAELSARLEGLEAEMEAILAERRAGGPSRSP